MKVMVFVKATRSSEAGELPSAELLQAMGQFNEELAAAGIILAGEGLRPSSEGVRVNFSGTSRTVMDGPFTETKELVAGYWLWQVDSLQQAIDWVKRCPNPMPEDSVIEIRPLYSPEDFGEMFTQDLMEQEAAVKAQILGLHAPRFQDSPAMKIAGLLDSYSRDRRAQIPVQWERFVPYLGKIPGQIDGDSYGVTVRMGPDCEIDYLTGVAILDAADLPEGFTSIDLAPQRYAVFTHSGHVMEIEELFGKIWSEWVPDAPVRATREVPCFERYTPEFNPETGLGGMEIWIPLQLPAV